MRTIFTVAIIFLALCNYAAMTSDYLTVRVANESSHKELYPILVCADGGPVPSTNSNPFRIGSDRFCYLSFAAGCSFDRSGNPVNCSTGGCGKGRCNSENLPVATMIVFDHGTVKTITVNGYNFGLRGVFQCQACPFFSCVIPLNTCPDNLRKYDNSGSLVGCNPGVGLPAGQDCPAPGTYSDPTVFTCPIKSAILRITVI